MCRRGRGCHRSRTAYTRPDRPAPEPSGSAAISDRANGVPDPTKSRYEAFCALCGLGLMYRVRCANAQSLGLVEPMRELPPVSGMGVQAPVGPGYEYDYYLRSGDEGLRTLSCWSKNAIGIELDPATRTIGEAPQVLVPYVPHSCQRSQTLHGNLIESVISNFVLASKPTRNVPVPPGFAPNFSWDTCIVTPPPPLTAGAAGTAFTPIPSTVKATYIIHSQCHEILKLAWERENVPRPHQHGGHVQATGDVYALPPPPPQPQPQSPNAAGAGPSSPGTSTVPEPIYCMPRITASTAEGTAAESTLSAGTGSSSTGADIIDFTETTSTAPASGATCTNNCIDPNHFLPALFTALHNLGRTPGKNYWMDKDCEFDSEADFPGLAEAMGAPAAECADAVDEATASATPPQARPHLGIVSSRAMWPHLNNTWERDEFCPGMDYTGAALVAVADPKEIPCLRELQKLTSGHGGAMQIPQWLTTSTASTSTLSTSTSTYSPPSSPPAADAYAQRCPSPSSFIWSPPPPPAAAVAPRARAPARITLHGPSSSTDPFTLLPPELLLQILTHLSLPHIASLRLSSRYLAAFVHPPTELPKSYFRSAFCWGGEFEFLKGLGGPKGWGTGGGAGNGREEVDWRALYRRVQFLLEMNPEAAQGRAPSGVVVPRSPGLANRRRIWQVAGTVAREMRRVMVDWAGGGVEGVAGAGAGAKAACTVLRGCKCRLYCVCG